MKTKKTLYCNFCRRNAQTVGSLIRGVVDSHICRDCVEFCYKIFSMDKEREEYDAKNQGLIEETDEKDRQNS